MVHARSLLYMHERVETARAERQSETCIYHTIVLFSCKFLLPLRHSRGDVFGHNGTEPCGHGKAYTLFTVPALHRSVGHVFDQTKRRREYGVRLLHPFRLLGNNTIYFD
jgi:hypothetical protein